MLNYIKNYPSDQKYLSLFPNGEQQPEMVKKREEIMESINQKV